MINPNWYPRNRQLRQFALAALIGFGLAGLTVRLHFGLHVVAIVLWVAGGLTFIIGMLKPRLVLPIYLGLMALAFPIGWVFTNVFLRVLYYGVMTPLGLIFRILGRDPLRLRKPDVESYWLVRKQRRGAEDYYRQA